MRGERFLRQYGVDQYVIDFYCPRLKLAIELDGDSHFIPGADKRDLSRQRHIESYCIHFLRYTNIDICDNIESVYDDIYGKIGSLTDKI